MKKARCGYCTHRRAGLVDGVCFDCRLTHRCGEFERREPMAPELVKVWRDLVVRDNRERRFH